MRLAAVALVVALGPAAVDAFAGMLTSAISVTVVFVLFASVFAVMRGVCR